MSVTQTHNPWAANSLAEGLEETLTLHKLGLVGELGARTRRVKRWVNSHQRQRWGAMAILETEPCLKKIPGAEHLPKLQQALAERVPKSYIWSISNRLRPPEVN